MTATTVSEVAAYLGRYLRENRASIMREQLIQDGIAAAFGEMGIEAEREHRLDGRSRLDFWLPEHGFAVEIKKDTATVQCMRQVGRYLEHAKIKGCIVVAMRCKKIPAEFQGKPIAQIELWRMLL